MSGEREQRDLPTVETRVSNTDASRLPLTPHRSPCLVIQTAFLGDVVLTTPLISALAERHGPVDVVTTPAAGSLLETHPAVRSVIRYDKHGRDRGISGLWKLSRELRSRRYSAVYLPHRSFRSSLLALLSRASERIGFAGSAGSLSYTRRVRRPEGCHEVERLLSLSPEPGHPGPVSLGLTSEDHREAERWLERHAITPGFVAVAPGSIWGTKRWPYYADLVKRLARPCVVIGSAADCDLADSIVTASPTRAVSAAGALKLRAAAALIGRAAVLVTNDSAPLHMATAVGTPVVALFGPTVPAFGFGPRRSGDLTLGLDQLPCRPCSKHGPERCPLGHHRCMRDLSVETVAEAVTAVLSAEESRAICPRN